MTTARTSRIWGAILLIITIFFLSLPAQAKYSGGTGEPNDPYQIATAVDLMLLGESPEDYDKHFSLTADIDLDPNLPGRKVFNRAIIAPDTDPTKLGFQGTPFKGVFDGNGRTISNFRHASANADYVGFFGSVGTWVEVGVVDRKGVIRDLGLISPNVGTGAGDFVGSLAGELKEGIISGCYVEGGSVVGDGDVGGLVGICGENEWHAFLWPRPLAIYNSCSTASVYGTSDVGGLVGSNYVGTIVNCYATGSVLGREQVGGLVGRNGNRPVQHSWRVPSTIWNCYSTGLVSGESHVGGLVGLHGEGSVVGSFWDMEASGQNASAGGVGKTTAEMKTVETFVGWGAPGKAPFLWWGSSNLEAVWTLDEGNDYPRLLWEKKPGTLIEGQLSDFLSGAGASNDPYLIYTGQQLCMIGQFPTEWGRHKHFKLMADIDLAGYVGTSFNLIGSDEYYPFYGVFDGNGHTISNLTYDCNGVNDVGLFRWVDGSMFLVGEEASRIDGKNTPFGLIKDLGLINPNIKAGRGSHIGSLVGHMGSGTITGCSVDGAIVEGYSAVGGLVGSNDDGLITASYARGSVSGYRNVGGLAGENSFSAYDFSIDPGWADPLVDWGSGRIEDCYVVCSVTGTQFVGGLVGSNRRGGEIHASFWDMETSGQATSAGGVGKTTTEMQQASTFLEAGWDFVDETENGTEDIWWILEGQSYPRLWWQYGRAFSPYPQDGVADVAQPVVLSWLPGASSVSHDVYFGEDEQAVANGTTESLGIYRGRQTPEMTTYDPGFLELEKTYYWRIDELDEADPNSLWKGSVWSFTTADFLVVDDFEDYNDYPLHEIWNTWIDGWKDPTNGSIVDILCYPDPYFNPAYRGFNVPVVLNGEQSMACFYDNTTAKYSEVMMTLVWPRNWTQYGVRVLSLWFNADLDNALEPMYVAVGDVNGLTAVVYHEDPNAVLIDSWTQWSIDLRLLVDQGVDLTNVGTISIGFGEKGNLQGGHSGLAFFDDIRLYRPQ